MRGFSQYFGIYSIYQNIKDMQKYYYTLLGYFTLLFSFTTQAQTIQQHHASLINNISRSATVWNSGGGFGKTTLCSYDTVNYVFNKTTQFLTISLNTSTSGNTALQYYPAPQAMTISGFEFYAWQTAGTSAVVPLTCRIFNANPVDSMPMGTALATTIVNVDSTFGSGVLTNIRKIATFSTPVTVTGPYILTIETGSTVNVAIVTNSFTASPPNGRSEWLSSVRIGTNTVRSYNVTVGSNQFNADFIIQPFVSFSLTANFAPSTLCNQGGNNIVFTNTSSPVLFSKFYSVRAWQNIPQFSCMWDYGDTSGIWYAVNGNRTYNYRVPYTVTLRDTLIGWTRGCSDVKQVQLNVAPLAPNAYSNSPVCLGGNLLLSCDTIPGASGYLWTGPNGYTSSQQNPTITNISIVNQGVYSVRAIANQCTSFVATTTVSIISTPVATSNSPLCAGQQLVLAVTNIPGATYSWTGPNGFSSNNVNPSKGNVNVNDSGNYSVSLTLPGCGVLGPFTTYVAVNPVPASPVASNNGPLCIGDNLNLSASSITGASYSWTGPNGFAASQQSPSRPSVITAFAGTYTVTATLNGCTSPAASTAVIINNIPAAPTASSNGPLCVGQTLSLTATPVPGATYRWSGPANFIDSVQNPTRSSVITAHSGTYSVYAEVNGCASPVASVNVSITTSTPTPVAGNNGPLCPGQTLQLTASAIAGATYSWTGPNGFTSSLQNPSLDTVSLSRAGLYSVTAVTTGCSISSAGSTNVTINTLPPPPAITSNSPLCDGQALNLNASTITGASYEWTGPNGFSSTTQNPSISSVSNLNAGTYSVTVTVPNCGTSSPANANIIIRRNPVPPSGNSNAPVCVGDTIRFFSSSSTTGPNRTFNWTGPNNFSSILQNPILPNANNNNTGLYQVTVSDSGCSSAPANVSVSLKALPSAPIASNNGPVCEGSNLQLNATNIAGASYQWIGPNNYSVFSQNPVISNIRTDQAGLYSVRSVVNGCFSNYVNTTVTVNPLPETPKPDNNGPACVGSNVTLTTAAVAGGVYSWTGPGGFNSALRNPVLNNVTLAQAGTYSVVVFVGTCGSLPGTTDVVVNPIPAPPVLSSLPANGLVCAGDSVMLFANFVSGATYEWTGPAGFGSTLQNPVLRNVISANTGTYSAKLTKAGCESGASQISITVNETPQTSTIFGPDTVRNFETHTYQVTGDVGSIFNWVMLGGTQQSGGTTNTISILWGAGGNGFVRVRETNTAGCRGPLQQQNVFVRNTTGVEELSLPTWTVYPVPVQDVLFIQPSEVIDGKTSLKLFNTLGQLQYETALMFSGTDAAAIPVHTLANGVYLMQLNHNGHTRTVRVQVSR
jgi:hypothetical protein